MEIEYELMLEDCRNFAKESRTIYGINKIAVIVIVSLVVLSVLLYDLPILIKIVTSHTISQEIIKVIYCIIMLPLIIYAVTPSFLGKCEFKKIEGQDKNYKITIEEDCITKSSSDIIAKYQFDKIKDIHNKKYNILIFVSDKHVLIIPKRAFKSEEEMNSFWNKLEELYNKSHNKNSL